MIHRWGAVSLCYKELYLLQKFKVTTWPKEDYGKFYDGDSYIILNVSTLSLDDNRLLFVSHMLFLLSSAQTSLGDIKNEQLQSVHSSVRQSMCAHYLSLLRYQLH